MTEQAVLLGDRYHLDRVIGRGGMAEVWRATDTRLGRAVAIKRLRVDLASDVGFQARFRREAQAAAGLNHPNIVSVYDTGEEIDTATGVAVPFIVMELVDGHTLKEVLRDDRRILPDRALEFTQGVLDALSYSHRAGIIHRDIKPGNVMLTPNGTVKVMDFGIARAVADTSATMTQTAAVIGTAQYLSPEQARGETVDARSDVYSSGCLLYELLVGRPPFIGDSPVSVAYQHVREVPTPPSTLDPEITQAMDAVVMKSLAKDPADRYQSAREMHDDIARIVAGAPVDAPLVPPEPPLSAPVSPDLPRAVAVPPPPPEPFGPEPVGRRPSVATVLLGILLAALIGVLVFALYEFNRPARPTSVQVPGVISYTQQRAVQQLKDSNLSPVVQTTNGPADTQGQVIRQNPTAQATVTPGSDVTIVVNLGPKTAQIPTGLTGLSVKDATSLLKEAGFKVNQQYVASAASSQKKDTVVSVNPGEGMTAPVGSTVTLMLSPGPTAVAVPTGLIGLSAADATNRLTEAGFKVAQEQATGASTAAAGTVASLSPNGGATAEASSTVTIYVATGRSAVPNLSGLTLGNARTYASDQGFTNVVVAGEQETTTNTPGTIISQDPQPGTTALRTDPIKVYIAKAPSTPSATATTSSSSSAPPSASASSSPSATATASSTPSNG